MATPYMSLSLPAVGTTPGPTWATQLVAALTAVDAHDHSPGKGVPVRTSGLYVDSGLSFGGYDATSLRSARFTSHAAPLALPADLSCLFVSAGELYYRDGSGNAIQLTSGGALNAASLGAIGGDYATSGASLAYASASKLFSFESSAGVKAHAALGNLSITEAVASGKAVTLRAPTGLAANYQLTLPAANPASTKIVTIDNTGAVGVVYDVDGVTLEVASNALRVKDGAITGAKLAAGAVDNSTVEIVGGALRVKDGGITSAKTNAVSTATASRLVVRDASGRAAFADPAAAGDAATMGWVQTQTAVGTAAVTGVHASLSAGPNAVKAMGLAWFSNIGAVTLGGTIVDATDNFLYGSASVLFTVPVGYRPSAAVFLPITVFTGIGTDRMVTAFVKVDTSGQVKIHVRGKVEGDLAGTAGDSFYFVSVPPWPV